MPGAMNPSDRRPKAVFISAVNTPRAQAMTKALSRAAPPNTACAIS